MTDFRQQQADQGQEEQEALQALMNISAAGFTKEADTLAVTCGLWAVWKQPIRERIAA